MQVTSHHPTETAGQFLGPDQRVKGQSEICLKMPFSVEGGTKVTGQPPKAVFGGGFEVRARKGVRRVRWGGATVPDPSVGNALPREPIRAPASQGRCLSGPGRSLPGAGPPGASRGLPGPQPPRGRARRPEPTLRGWGGPEPA